MEPTTVASLQEATSVEGTDTAKVISVRHEDVQQELEIKFQQKKPVQFLRITLLMSSILSVVGLHLV